ncbi:zinc-ribbon domain-containing protein [Hydrogenophaga taeniospiralis]|uniref:zinc-ribbon domain-containing protein n=1 Tax=Hydrogenophaga taeniospiralis TaxID=65656 RepID=UPI001CFABD19|nr:zinc-ribbon domain-containing protein [Hydrogenophaga taeniospiralis]MCB4362785.1 zinc-ribbon domain-containing protein [Hydrogenophaga taeniospiralis]
MKSSKQRRVEIKQLRLARAQRAQTQLKSMSLGREGHVPGLVMADTQLLSVLNNSCVFPAFYVDKAFVCVDCSTEEVWTAKQQKWWYEEVQAPIDSQAKRCLVCRRARRSRIKEALAVPGANRLAQEVEALRALGAKPPDAAALEQVANALQSKWWGHRVVAIQVLGRWGGAEEIAQLRTLAALRHTEGCHYRSWERVASDEAAVALRSLGIDVERGVK